MRQRCRARRSSGDCSAIKKYNVISLKVSGRAPRPSGPVPAGNGSPEPLKRRQRTCLRPLCEWKSEIDRV